MEPENRVRGQSGIRLNMCYMLPPIQDLEWVVREKKWIRFDWTKPRDVTGTLIAAEYDIRFLKGGLIRSEEEFLRATSISTDPSQPFCGSDTSNTEVFVMGFSPSHQLLERERGSYAVMYRDNTGMWSGMSNVLMDEANRIIINHADGVIDKPWLKEPSEFEVHIEATVGLSAEIVGVTTMYIQIRDCKTRELEKFQVDIASLDLGAPASVTWSFPGEWSKFTPKKNIRLSEFMGKGMSVLYQGVAMGIGYGRCEIIFYESGRDALAGVNRLTSGIDCGGWILGLDATGLQKGVGVLEKDKRHGPGG